MIYEYKISELRPLISWLYFEHAWGVAKADEESRSQLRGDAEKMLDDWEGRYACKAILLRLPANSEGDDILVGADEAFRLPMLRQQKPQQEGMPLLSMADFIRPKAQGMPDVIGVFCTTMDSDIEERYKDDPYERMLSQTIADRLAEAAAERLNQEMPGIRPAVGYPMFPDMSMNFLLDDILNMQQIGISLTESGMMRPHASVSGVILQNPHATYFNVGPIGEDQLQDYAARRGFTLDEMRKFIR